jgi:hypothetical protein
MSLGHACGVQSIFLGYWIEEIVGIAGQAGARACAGSLRPAAYILVKRPGAPHA